jgi:hypothetical protein
MPAGENCSSRPWEYPVAGAKTPLQIDEKAISANESPPALAASLQCFTTSFLQPNEFTEGCGYLDHPGK